MRLLSRLFRRSAGTVVRAVVGLGAGATAAASTMPPLPAVVAELRLEAAAAPATDGRLQRDLEALDARLRGAAGMKPEQTSAAVLDLRTGRLAWVRPDRMDYAASVPKVAILLGWFEAHGDPAALDAATRHELGLMIKRSDNAIAAKHSQALGLKAIQALLEREGFYDATRGGGLWLGKHYGKGDEMFRDPVGQHSHGATVRQVLRFLLRLEQGSLVSAEASRAMREIFASPEIAHIDDKFVRGLAGREVAVRRKAGWWETWAHDAAVVTGGGRHYAIVAMTHHPQGETYLVEFARAVDEWLTK